MEYVPRILEMRNELTLSSDNTKAELREEGNIKLQDRQCICNVTQGHFRNSDKYYII